MDRVCLSALSRGGGEEGETSWGFTALHKRGLRLGQMRLWRELFFSLCVSGARMCRVAGMVF